MVHILHPETPEIIRTAYQSTAGAVAFARELAIHGIYLARITGDEAKESAQHEPRHLPGDNSLWAFREGEIVAVDSVMEVYRLARNLTGSDFGDMQRYLRLVLKDEFKRNSLTDCAIKITVRKTPPPPPDSPGRPQRERELVRENSHERYRECEPVRDDETIKRRRDYGRGYER